MGEKNQEFLKIKRNEIDIREMTPLPPSPPSGKSQGDQRGTPVCLPEIGHGGGGGGGSEGRDPLRYVGQGRLARPLRSRTAGFRKPGMRVNPTPG